MVTRTFSTALLWSLWIFLASVPLVGSELPPELRASEVQSHLGMVATGSPEATEAAVAILEGGGNAIDAAVAAALVLGVADSDASGLGGMTYMLIRLASGHAVAIDGTARVPGRLDLEAFRAARAAGGGTGHAMVAVPTTLAVLDLALSTYGTRTLPEVIQPAIDVAENGYRVSPIQITWTRQYHQDLLATSFYLPFLIMEDGRTVGEPGRLNCNQDLAHTLREIAQRGARSFYRGAIADRIEADMVQNGGNLRKADLVMLRVRRAEPVFTTYRGVKIISVPPPAGGDSLVTNMDILETFPPAFLATDSLGRHHAFIEINRMALGSRARMWSTGLVGTPLASPGQRKALAPALAKMIQPGTALSKEAVAGSIDPDCLPVGESTTHISIVDGAGNAVSLTQTLGQSFGAKVATPGLGFIYNNFLSAFKVDKPHCPGFLNPHGLCPNDMAPTIMVENDGRVTVLGTPGSNRIPSILAGVISNLFDREMSLRQAIEAPRILWGGGKDINIEMEVAGALTDDLVDAFNSMDYEYPVEPEYFPIDPYTLANFGGVNAVSFDPVTNTCVGVVDPRRGGLAKGPRVIASND